MERAYPPALRDAGIGGTVHVLFSIDEDGVVRDFRVDESSGHPALDRAALSVAEVYRFSPALNRDKRVAVWVSFPITFQVRDGAPRRRGSRRDVGEDATQRHTDRGGDRRETGPR